MSSMARAFRLKKDLPGSPKGKIMLQGEDMYACVDENMVVEFTVKTELVENSPEWFEEVYRITPDYMNAEERELYLKCREVMTKVKSENRTAPSKPKKKVKRASWHKQGKGVYHYSGGIVISERRMQEVLGVLDSVDGSVFRAAAVLKVKPGTVSLYRTIAKKYGLV